MVYGILSFLLSWQKTFTKAIRTPRIKPKNEANILIINVFKNPCSK